MAENFKAFPEVRKHFKIVVALNGPHTVADGNESAF